MDPTSTEITIAGAGSIGSYVGGCLAHAGRSVRLLARGQSARRLSRGLSLSDLEGFKAGISPDRLQVTTDPASGLAGARVILVCVKSGGTLAMAEVIAQHAPPDAIIVSLQNGVRNAERLRRVLPSATVLAGMVPFNVVQSDGTDGGLRVHRATSGTILVEDGAPGLVTLLDTPHARVRARTDMPAVQWGKLILNLNNALNALSGLALADQLARRPWRRLLAEQMQEGLACLRAAGITAAGTEGIPPRLIPTILRLPDALFTRLARRMLAIDPAARSSMWEDLSRGRPTEIAELQGEILALAERHGIAAPITRRIVAAVQEAERRAAGSPHLSVEQLRGIGKSA